MYIIFNNDTEHKVPITEGSYDYLTSTFFIKNTIIEEWTSEIISYILSLKDTTITSIVIKSRDDKILYTYDNLRGKLTSFEQLTQTPVDSLIYTIFFITIENKETE